MESTMFIAVFNYIANVLDAVMPFVIAYVIYIWAVIGFYYLFKYIYTVIHGLYAWILRPCKNLRKCYGAWAIVTGATDGIGEALAIELASKGLNIVLIARDANKLAATSQKILLGYPNVKCKVIVVDFSAFNNTARALVAESIKGLDIGVMINNVGASYSFPKYFHELRDSNVADVMSVNIESTTWMTRLVLPCMIEKRCGAIVNMSSATGVTVSPLLSEYSAAKSYVTMFSKAMSVELSDFDIHVQAQIPLYVSTKMSKIRRTSFFVPSASSFARASVACIGYESVVSPYWSHAVQLWVLSFIPEWFLEAVMVKWMHYGIRTAGLKSEAVKRLS